MSESTSGSWYREGLAFECTRCGRCCRGEPGYVWVTLEECSGIAASLSLTREEFLARYVRNVGRLRSLIERANGDCVFWSEEQGCSIYQDRPTQCRTWPFWPENIESPQAWERTCKACPGSGAGRIYSVEEIEGAARFRRR